MLERRIRIYDSRSSRVKKFAFLMREEEDKVQSTSAKQISQTISTYSMQLCQLSCHKMETNSIEIAVSVLSVVA